MGFLYFLCGSISAMFSIYFGMYFFKLLFEIPFAKRDTETFFTLIKTAYTKGNYDTVCFIVFVVLLPILFCLFASVVFGVSSLEIFKLMI